MRRTGKDDPAPAPQSGDALFIVSLTSGRTSLTAFAPGFVFLVISAVDSATLMCGRFIDAGLRSSLVSVIKLSRIRRSR